MYLDGVFLSSFCTAIYGDTQDVLFSSSFRVLSLCQSGLRRISLHLMGPGCFCFTSILPHISSLHPILLIHNAFPFHFFILPQPPPANRQSPPSLFLIPIQPHLTPITSTPVYVFVVSKQVVADGLFIFFSLSVSVSVSYHFLGVRFFVLDKGPDLLPPLPLGSISPIVPVPSSYIGFPYPRLRPRLTQPHSH